MQCRSRRMTNVWENTRGSDWKVTSLASLAFTKSVKLHKAQEANFEASTNHALVLQDFLTWGSRKCTTVTTVHLQPMYISRKLWHHSTTQPPGAGLGNAWRRTWTPAIQDVHTRIAIENVDSCCIRGGRLVSICQHEQEPWRERSPLWNPQIRQRYAIFDVSHFSSTWKFLSHKMTKHPTKAACQVKTFRA